jgi:hypothetical protein
VTEGTQPFGANERLIAEADNRGIPDMHRVGVLAGLANLDDEAWQNVHRMHGISLMRWWRDGRVDDFCEVATLLPRRYRRQLPFVRSTCLRLSQFSLAVLLVCRLRTLACDPQASQA